MKNKLIKRDLFNKFSLFLANFGKEVSAYSIILMTFLIIINTVFRAVPGLPSLYFVEEYSGYLFVIITFMGLGDTFVQGGHVRVTFLSKWLTGKAAIYMEIIVTLIGIFIVSILTYFAWEIFVRSYENNSLAQSVMQTPLWIPRFFLVPGYIIFIIQLLNHLRLNINSIRFSLHLGSYKNG